MNNTYIMGNEFDLNLGLKTRYEDFYRWYVNQSKVDKPDVVICLWLSTLFCRGKNTAQTFLPSFTSERILGGNCYGKNIRDSVG